MGLFWHSFHTCYNQQKLVYIGIIFVSKLIEMFGINGTFFHVPEGKLVCKPYANLNLILIRFQNAQNYIEWMP